MDIKIFDSEGNYLGLLVRDSGADCSYGVYPVGKGLLEAAGKAISFRCQVPILDVHGYWTADMILPRMVLDWRFGFSHAAHRNFPFLTFFNDSHANRASIGHSNLFDDGVISAAMNQETGAYDLEFTLSVSEHTRPFEFFVGLADESWIDSLAGYRAWLLPQGIPDYPAAAWEPVYCTWYAVHAEVRQDWLEANAMEAARLGCGTFIVDDGWCFDDMKRVNPTTISSWYERIGDWEVSEAKLPDFGEHVKKVQALGLKYLLWVSPFFAGSRSKFYGEIRSEFLTPEHEGYRIFDPADPDAVNLSLGRLTGLMEDYGLDGLKVDFIDMVPQSVDNPHGRDVYGFVEKLSSRLRKLKADALIEFRQRYATPVMLMQATQFRAGDVPFDFLANLHRIAQIRIVLGDRVPVHADPVYWHPQESSANVSRHMICSLAGVPMLSMDLPGLPPEHKAIIENWLGFYRCHLETFKAGRWTVRYDCDSIGFITVERDLEKIVFLCNSDKLEKAVDGFSGGLHIFNLSREPLESGGGTAFDCLGQPVDRPLAPCGGRLEISGIK